MLKPALQPSRPTLAHATRVWFKIGVLSFGGPAAQISLMHREVVEREGWLSEQQYLNALSFCMLLPGPEAMQLATYAGWRLHGTLGGLIAGLLFVLPGAMVIFALASIYGFYGQVPLVAALFLGIKAAVLVIVLQALLKIARRALKNWQHWLIAGLAFVGIFFFSIPFPLIVLAAAIYGFWRLQQHQQTPDEPLQIINSGKTFKTIALWLGIWLLPLVALTFIGAPVILTDLARFFSTLAIVSFGGAYAALAYMAQDVVVGFGWLDATQMIDALGLAETTPGPLILVTQFVGYLAAFNQGGLWLGLAGGLVALWATFAPCFLWIFAGAPYIEWLSSLPRLKGALNAITAAVVGVMLNLSLWFSLHVLFANVTRQQFGALNLWTPQLSSIEWAALALFALSAVLSFRFKLGILWILLISSLAGATMKLVF